MHSKSDNTEIMINDEADEVIKELFHSLKNRHQNNLESIKSKINPNCGRSYIDSLGWIKCKKAPINPINKKVNKCFQRAVTVALNHEVIKKDPQRITEIKAFTNKYNWEGINFPSEKDDWKKIEKTNVTMALNVLYAKKVKIYPAFVSKHNSNREKKLFF